MDAKEVNKYSAKSLAFLGDAVYSLMTREKLVKEGDVSLAEYTKKSKLYVSAKAQNKVYHELLPLLSDDEKDALRRGRNSTMKSRAKNASVAEYRHSTGVEALFGHLYLLGRTERLQEIFGICAKICEGNF